MKDAGMRIRVEPELREKFVNICREKDVPAAQVLRSFMREFIESNSIKTRAKTTDRVSNAKLGIPRAVTNAGV
jgi:hypothetical protein